MIEVNGERIIAKHSARAEHWKCNRRINASYLLKRSRADKYKFVHFGCVNRNDHWGSRDDEWTIFVPRQFSIPGYKLLQKYQKNVQNFAIQYTAALSSLYNADGETPSAGYDEGQTTTVLRMLH